MLRDVFYYGSKPNVHPREKFAKDLIDARNQATTEHFWIINEFCDYRNFEWDFDFEFLPDEDVWAEEHNNVWPSQHQKDSGTWLCPKEHSDLIVYRTDVPPTKRKNIKSDNWVCLDNIDESRFDFSWHPDPTDPPYIYRWGCKFFPAQFKHVLEYRVEGATDIKYMREIVELLPNDYWVEHQAVDHDHFDFSWRPDPMEPPLIYVWGNKYVDGTVAPTLEYHVPGATETKYLPELIPILSQPSRFQHLEDSYGIDYAWIPDPSAPPYIYVWGNQWNKPEDKISIQYVVEGATEYKYMEERAIRKPSMKNWVIPDNIDTTGFDFSWEPSPADPAFIYEFGTQHQKTGGPRYVVEGAIEYKYIDIQKVKALPTTDRWVIPNNIDVTEFDFSWHPDSTDPAYIYQFGTQWALSGGPKYVMPEASEIKYMDNMTAKALPNKDNWEVPAFIDADNFDFSWHPYAEDEPYIYQFGTQHQKTGGPRYLTPGTHKNSQVKYIDTRILKATRLPNKKAFAVLNNVSIKDFDYSWHPDTTEEPFVYLFGNQWYDAVTMPTIEYAVPGAKQVKYVDSIKATIGANKNNWVIHQPIDEESFDFSWVPNPNDPPYIYRWGNKFVSSKYKPTIDYVVPDATEIKYMTDDVKVLPEWDRWEIPENVDTSDFDFSWRPDPLEANLIWQFGTQWQKTGGPRYVVPDATEIKYVDTMKARALPSTENWEVPEKIDISGFDFSWHPDDTDPAYIYKFSTQWAITGGPIYRVPGATEIKYVDSPSAIALPDRSNWVVPKDVDAESFDFSWHPYSEDEPYVYEFGTQWQKTGGPKYVTPGTTGMSATKYIDTRILKSKRLPNMNNWVLPEDVVIKKFDYSWHPDSTDDLYIYQFGTQHQKTGGPKYVPPSAKIGITPIKYVNTDIIKAIAAPNLKYWTIPENIDTAKFDFSWHPDETEPRYIIQFGTIKDKTDGPIYTPENNLGKKIYKLRIEKEEIEEEVEDVNALPVDVLRYYIETTLEDLVKLHPNEIFWALRSNIDYTSFDFSWRPQIVEISWESDYVHVFGSSESEITQTYFVNSKSYLDGKKDFKFVENKKLDAEALSELFIKPSMFFVDRGNPEAQMRFESLKMRFPDIQKTRYLNTWVDTINRCINRSSTELCWILNSELDYTDFDFHYYPNPWQMKMVHVFGSQWSHWGTTFMVNRDSFANDTKYIKIIEHLSNLNFVKDQNKRAKATNCLYDIFVVDHGNKEMLKVFRTIQHKANDKPVTNVEYKGNYLDTFKDILAQCHEKKEHYIWVCSSLCDYSDFDFTYICDPFAREQLHVFPSGNQKYGDTFLVNVNQLRQLIEGMTTLQEYNKINFNRHQVTKRYPAPVIVTGDTHTSTPINFDYPYAELITSDNIDIEQIPYEPQWWSEEVKNIIVSSTGGTRIIVPKEAKDVVKREFYDYPYIVKSSRLAKSKPLDIVFLSNGEPGADENYEHLLNVTKGLNNRIVRVDGVNGRVAAYHAAAEASETPWMFTVFAKLKVSNKFDWNWQPDRLQVPKHYVFHAKNPLNNLVYGHQAMIAYNKKMTLANQGKGLDFTQDDVHEVLEINSGVANFNVDEWTTWRTAFREAIKLCTYGDEVSQERLKVWTTVANGNFAKYCLDGANDAVDYFDEVAGDFDQLKLSYDWAWLQQRFNKIYGK